ncbi:hypothetical protein MNBD_GAMMA11-1746, partial [hydrothermal vent metagenome]
MKKILHLKKSILSVSIALLISTNSMASDDKPSSDEPSTVSGVITSLDGITVNGVKYDSDDTEININGSEGSENQLNVGDIITLQGRSGRDGDSTTTISSSNALTGYTIDTSGLNSNGTGRINVMGQTVNITPETIFNSSDITTISDLAVNDIVKVQGFSNGNGTITATRIETIADQSKTSVEGMIRSLDTSNMSFMLGTLKVMFGNADELPSNLANGMFIQATTRSAPTGNLENGVVMNASKIKERSKPGTNRGSRGNKVKIQGVVSNITENSFDLNGSPVDISSLKKDNEFNMASLVNAMIVTVEGTIGSEGEIIARKIKNNASSNLQARGTVTSINGNTISILSAASGGLTNFTINSNTRLIDKMDQGTGLFSLADIATGDYIEIDYSIDSNTGNTVTTRLTRSNAPETPSAPTNPEIPSAPTNPEAPSDSSSSDSSSCSSSSSHNSSDSSSSSSSDSSSSSSSSHDSSSSSDSDSSSSDSSSCSPVAPAPAP